MPAAASSSGSPSFTNANEKTSTADTAKNSVVNSTSQLFASMATSLRSTSSAVRKPRPLQRFVHDREIAAAVQPREEGQVLPRGEFRVQIQLVREESDPATEIRAEHRRRVISVTDLARRWCDERRHDPDERRL